MGKLLLRVALVLILAHFFTLAGLLGYGVITGRFDGEKMEQYLATWRGEKLVAPVPVEEVAEEQEGPNEASARIASQEVEDEIFSREQQRQSQLLRNLKFTVEAARAKLQKDIRVFQVEKTAYAAQKQANEEKMKNEGFITQLKIYEKMKPKYVKNDFMQMAETDAVRFISAMKSDVAKKILEQFRTMEEEQKRQYLMKLLGQGGEVAVKN
ncbi:MAG: hypothetical protein IID32_11350 [Planctomycetes bacterium]|nr:hypothetical protein [Planctomycetota bacterium]